MGLRSWIKRHTGHGGRKPSAEAPIAVTAATAASAIAAGHDPTSEFRIKRVLVANPEHRTVSIIASALAAGALEQSSLTVMNIYKINEEGRHAA